MVFSISDAFRAYMSTRRCDIPFAYDDKKKMLSFKIDRLYRNRMTAIDCE